VLVVSLAGAGETTSSGGCFENVIHLGAASVFESPASDSGAVTPLDSGRFDDWIDTLPVHPSAVVDVSLAGCMDRTSQDSDSAASSL